MTGHQLLRLLAKLPAEELDLDAKTLVDVYDGRGCADCGGVHRSVWAAIACDGLTDARERREKGHRARQVALQKRRRERGERANVVAQSAHDRVMELAEEALVAS